MIKFFKGGQRSQSRSHIKNLWFRRKGLVIKYTHAKYKSPISWNKKIWPMLKFLKVIKRSWSRSHIQNRWFYWKGLVIRYTHAKYENPISYNKKKVMVMVTSLKFMVTSGQGSHMSNMKECSLRAKKSWPMLKFFKDRRTDRQTIGQADRVITIGHPPSDGT